MKRLKYIWLILCCLPISGSAQTAQDISRWEKQARQVTIIRDNWGIPHVYGKTDADAVFGLLYAQCEDDYARVEMNYIEKLGLLSSVKGESRLYDDLLIRMIIDPEEAKADYNKAPAWLKKLCVAFADAINYYLYKHPEIKPLIGRRYEPWFPLLWTDGSIGAINTDNINAADIRALYGTGKEISFYSPEEPEEISTGSNGFAFSPRITESGKAILYINPHVTFYFRPEVHMVSEEGLNAYGAVTWGQFFIYQGFNQHCGWMHTSSDIDAADSYIEKLVNKNGKWFYEYNKSLRPVIIKKISFPKISGVTGSKTFNVLYTHHGPVMAKKNNQYLSVRADNRILNGLIQCWQRTKTRSFADFKKTLDLQGNISNNTVYADAEGNIGYWHGNRVPKRDPTIDWSKPVDGSLVSTEWKGYHPIREIVQCINPANGWVQNCNSTPFTVAGVNSPPRNAYPAYMAPDGENFRGINAVRVLSEKQKFSFNDVIGAGYDRRLPAFELIIPALIRAWESSHTKMDISNLERPIRLLKEWNLQANENSVAMTLAVSFGEKVLPAINRVSFPPGELSDLVLKTKKYVAEAKSSEWIDALSTAVEDLKKKYGTWEIAWGEINRFQRISPDIENKFDDSKPSLPVPFASATWGMLPSYVSRIHSGTKKRYGTNGNSFVCAVEFGKKIKAKSLLAGGESGNPQSPNFFDQGVMYTKGEFKEVLFYKEDVMKNVKRKYHPGEK